MEVMDFSDLGLEHIEVAVLADDLSVLRVGARLVEALHGPLPRFFPNSTGSPDSSTKL